MEKRFRNKIIIIIIITLIPALGDCMVRFTHYDFFEKQTNKQTKMQYHLGTFHNHDMQQIAFISKSGYCTLLSRVCIPP